MFYKKLIVTFTLSNGKEFKVKCKHIEITKSGNDIVGYKITGMNKRRGDEIFYLRLDSVVHISTQRVFW